jgi:hypothetical protein
MKILLPGTRRRVWGMGERSLEGALVEIGESQELALLLL